MDKEIPSDIHAARPQRFPQQGRVAIITADGVEDQEFFYPYYRFLEAGYVVDVLTPKGRDLKGKNGAGLADTVRIEDANADEYDLLYIPGGKAPAKLKKEREAVKFVQQFCQTGRPVGAICHGPQLLAEAGVINARKIAAWPECEEEVEKAGAFYHYTECVKDGPFITGRWPGDLPGQMKAVMEALDARKFPQKRVA